MMKKKVKTKLNKNKEVTPTIKTIIMMMMIITIIPKITTNNKNDNKSNSN